MKKLTKRIMALLLSLVMIFGCIPSFTNEASATAINTIEDVLNTVEDSFPTTVESSWKSIGGGYVYRPTSTYSLLFCKEGEVDKTTFTNIQSWNVVKSGDNYVDSTKSLTFIMENGHLVSIEATNIDYPGTYKSHITVADVLATVEGVFPNEPLTGWISNDGYTAFCSGDTLWIQNTSESNTIDINTVLTLNADGNYENTDKQIIFVMTNGKLTSIDYEFNGFAGTYEPAEKTLTVNYEQPKTYEEFMALSSDAITASANATSISGFTKSIDLESLYVVTEHPDFLGYFVILTPITFEDDVHCNAVKRVYLRDIDLGVPTKTLTEILPIASTIDYAVAKEANTILVIEKFDFSKKLNITASLNANAKILDAVSSIKDNLTDDGIARNYYITAEPDGSSMQDDDILEAGKKYYLHGEITKVEDSIFYKQVSINNEVIPNLLHIDSNKPYSCVNTIYSYDEPESCGFVFCYEFTVASNSSGSKKYKASDSKDTAEKVSGSGKKGSTRTITPIEGKKVSSVIVRDKNENIIDVALNEDGTYSFVQPASDVTIEVNYKNREITLNIGSTEASVDGEKSNLDVCPVIRNDRTMLPIRYVAENLGAKVEWSEKNSNYVAITRGNTKIEITLGSDIMLVNGKEVKLDSVAFAENDRTYLPVRAISEALNAIVEWNESEPSVVKIYERQ